MNLKDTIKFSLKNGLLYIFFSNVFNKLVQFSSSIIIIKFINKVTYGQWSYANNVLSFFLLFSGLGVSSGLLQFISEKNDNEIKKIYFKSGLYTGLLINLLISFVIFLFCVLFSLPIVEAAVYLKKLAFIPIFLIFIDVVSVYFRATLKNTKFAIYSSLNAFLVTLFMIIGIFLFGINGLIIGRYIGCFLIVIIGCFLIKNDFHNFRNISVLKKNEYREFFRYSYICALSTSISGILYLVDTFLIGIFVRDASVVASYKTATLIPFALNFIPMSIITFVYPYFVKKNKDYKTFENYYKKLMLCMGLINIVISVSLFVFAKTIIYLVFGEDYSDSIMPFRILVLGYFVVSTFRIPAGNLLPALRQVKFTLIDSIFCGFINIVLDIFLIIKMGAIGAAIATVLVFIIDGIISNVYLSIYLKKKQNNFFVEEE